MRQIVRDLRMHVFSEPLPGDHLLFIPSPPDCATSTPNAHSRESNHNPLPFRRDLIIPPIHPRTAWVEIVRQLPLRPTDEKHTPTRHTHKAVCRSRYRRMRSPAALFQCISTGHGTERPKRDRRIFPLQRHTIIYQTIVCIHPHDSPVKSTEEKCTQHRFRCPTPNLPDDQSAPKNRGSCRRAEYIRSRRSPVQVFAETVSSSPRVSCSQ